MSTLFQQREATAKKVSPYVAKALEEFGRQKWKGELLGGKKFSIYYQNGIELFPEEGRFEWIIRSDKRRPMGHGIYEYPCYRVQLWFEEDDSVAPDSFLVYYGGEYGGTDFVDTREFSESALKQALSEILANNHSPTTRHTGDFDYEETKRLK